MRKDECRKIYKSKRAALSEKQRDDLSIAIANQSLKLPIWHLEHFHIFMPIEAQKEIDTTPLITVLQAKEKHIYIPKVGTRGINAIGQENDKTIVGRVHPNHGSRIAGMTKSFRAYQRGGIAVFSWF